MSPFDAPGTYSLLQYTELTEGIWYPIGGFHKVSTPMRTCAIFVMLTAFCAGHRGTCQGWRASRRDLQTFNPDISNHSFS